jgi:hypothetical protein
MLAARALNRSDLVYDAAERAASNPDAVLLKPPPQLGDLGAVAQVERSDGVPTISRP